MGGVGRRELEDDAVRRAVREAGFGHLLLPDDVLDASLEATLSLREPGLPVWVFAYGSLIWRPLMQHVERRDAQVHGFHRGFYLRSFVNRGSPAEPGLVLALDRGGSCRGVTYRLDEDAVAGELRLLWRREMIMGTYEPRWLRARTPGGAVQALAFVVNRALPQTYAGRISDEEIVRIARTARGHYGSCAEYVMQTALSLESAGMPDRRLSRLAEKLKDQR